MDILPPQKRPLNANRPPSPTPPAVPLKQPSQEVPSLPPAPKNPQPLSIKKPRRRWWLYWLLGICIVVLAVIASAWGWYAYNLSPRDTHASRVRISLPEGSTAAEIGTVLKQNNIIRSTTAFRIYIELTRVKNQLKAGSYRFSAAQSVPQIVDDLAKGRTDAFNVTILPGSTLSDIKKVLQKSGFGTQEIDQALNKNYNHPLLATKPPEVNLDGYIYPETYQVDSDTTVETLLVRTFDQFEKVIKQNDLEAKLAARGFTLHQGVTLASIIQKEVSKPADQRQVAQIFEKRLSEGGALGSDVTYIYAAKLLGVEPRASLDSPYNTRLHPGLPPGAIGNFQLSALEAVVNPAPGDYLYFVAGDDGTTHFARTLDEHQVNIKKYCHTLCSQ